MTLYTRWIPFIKTQLNLTSVQLAQLCGVTSRTVDRWERGENFPTGANEALLDGLHAVAYKKSDRELNLLTSLVADSIDKGGLPHLLSSLVRLYLERKEEERASNDGELPR